MGRASARQHGAQSTRWALTLDVLHEDGDLLVRAELPGIKREDVEVTPQESRGE